MVVICHTFQPQNLVRLINYEEDEFVFYEEANNQVSYQLARPKSMNLESRSMVIAESLENLSLSEKRFHSDSASTLPLGGTSTSEEASERVVFLRNDPEDLMQISMCQSCQVYDQVNATREN